MDNWVIKNKIKSGDIPFKTGDKVILFRRKGKKGYPKRIKDNDEYIVTGVVNDFLVIAKHSLDAGFSDPYRIHKTYMIQKSLMRDIKIDEILR
jgi:uncharacterized pyridoxamine 5'-phosphate oxidase family protein